MVDVVPVVFAIWPFLFNEVPDGVGSGVGAFC